MISGSAWLICALEWNRALLTTPLTRGARVSMPTFKLQEDMLYIHRDIN